MLVTCVVSFEYQISFPNGFQFSINSFPFMSPNIPVLLQVLSGAKKAYELLPVGSVYGVHRNKSVELTIPGGATGGPVSVQRLLLFGSRHFDESIPPSTRCICTGTHFG